MSYADLETSRYGGKPVECYRFTHVDQTWRWTSADQPVQLSVGQFTPVPISRTGFATSEEDGAGMVEVSVMRDNPVAAMVLPILPVQPITLTIFRAHRGDNEVVLAWQGEVVSGRPQGAQVVLACAPALYPLRNKLPSMTYQTQCNHALYGAGCQVDPSSFRVPALVSVVSGATLTVGAAAAFPDGWFNAGWVQRDNGERRFILGHTGDQLTLHWAFSDLASTEEVDLYPGCDRTEQVCATKFGNLVNHFGFPRIPTKNPFDGSIT